MHRPAAKRNFCCLLVVTFALAAFECSSVAAAPQKYFTRTWQVEQGLPQNKVTAVVQTRDGYLWLGTYNGLARFDGVRFMVFDDHNTPQLRSSRITSLFEAADGVLWIGTESGDISQYKEGHFSAVPVHANWSGGKVYTITSDDAGDMWIWNESAELVRMRDGKVLSPLSGMVAKVISLARAQNGTIWVEREGMVSELKDDRFLSVALSTNDYVQGFCSARDGGFWVACNSGVRKWKDGQWTDFGPAPWEWKQLVNMLETSSGALAGGTSDAGLWLLFPGRTNVLAEHFSHTNGLLSDWVISLCEDREKNLWCGTGAGLALIRPSNIEVVSPPDKWKSRPVLSVLPTPDGALWVGTEGAGLYRLRNGTWKNFSTDEGVGNQYVWSLAADDAGKTWVGTWGGGVYRQKEDSFEFAPGLEGFRSPVPALSFFENALWIGATTGLLRFRNGNLEPFGEITHEPFGDVRVVQRDKTGVMWVGTAGSGLVCLQDGKFRRFRKGDGLSSDFIECLHFADDGAMWIGTFGGGLNRFKNGKFFVIDRNRGLPNGVIGHIESDDGGYFWMSSYNGILRASEKDLNRCADGEVTEAPFLTYGINDGLPTLECSEGLQSAGAKTADGRLWFATAKGLVVVNPASVITNSLAPPVRIEEVRVDDKSILNETEKSELGNRKLASLKIPPGRHRIEFEYTALSFVAPEKVRFRCRLNNLETDWTDADTKRVAIYSYIPPGSYSFQVIACNNDGVWNETGASLAFEVLPHFWQTTWFHVLGGFTTVLIASGAVWFETRRRLRRRLERAERQRDIERERTRIAQDIHDDLGAQLTRITMMSESARGEVTNADRAASRLEKIYDTARELTRSMDEIVWAVNPRHDTLEGLATYLEKFAQDWLAAAGIRCRLDLPLQFPDWHLTSEVRHNVFLAFKEALHNSVKHSGASEVSIRLVLDENSFQLTVEDNGSGFAIGETVRSVPDDRGRVASGNGLENMKRRLSGIGGSFVIQSRPGEGTKVIFKVLHEG